MAEIGSHRGPRWTRLDRCFFTFLVRHAWADDQSPSEVLSELTWRMSRAPNVLEVQRLSAAMKIVMRFQEQTTLRREVALMQSPASQLAAMFMWFGGTAGRRVALTAGR